MKYFWRSSKKKEEPPLPAFEVEVAPDEMWTIWSHANDEQISLVFPTFMFSRFAELVLSPDRYKKYVSARFRGMIQSSKERGEQYENIVEETVRFIDRKILEDHSVFYGYSKFCYFGEDGVKAMRLVQMSRQRQAGSYERNWEEIPISLNVSGTIFYKKHQIYPEVVPMACIDHSRVLRVVGDAWNAKVFMPEGEFSIPGNRMSESSKIFSRNTEELPPESRFLFTLIERCLRSFKIDRESDWNGFVLGHIQKYCIHDGMSFSRKPPIIDTTASDNILAEQVYELLKWAYLNGIFCRIFVYADGALTRRHE